MVPDGWKNSPIVSCDLEQLLRFLPDPNSVEVTINKCVEQKVRIPGALFARGGFYEYHQTEPAKKNVIPTFVEVAAYYFARPRSFFDKHFGIYAKNKKNFESTYARELSRGEYIHTKLVWPEQNIEIAVNNQNKDNVHCVAMPIRPDSAWSLRNYMK